MGQKDKAGMVGTTYLPDTNVLIFALAGKKPYSEWLRSWIKERKLILSAIVVAEFLSGARDEEEIVFRDLLENFKVLPVDSIVAQVAASYRKKFKKKAKRVWLSDCLIAATCSVFGVTLVTFDSRDYPMEDVNIKIK